jgi:hypothetical protein
MSPKQKFFIVSLYSLPIVGMIALIPLVTNDYLLAGIYTLCILGILSVYRQKYDVLACVFGFVGITLSELLFVSSGVETFTHQTLFGMIPLWLPFLWAYAFVTITRSLRVLDK